jgi:hypothetical protein
MLFKGHKGIRASARPHYGWGGGRPRYVEGKGVSGGGCMPPTVGGIEWVGRGKVGEVRWVR